MNIHSFIGFCDYLQDITPVLEMFQQDLFPDDLHYMPTTESVDPRNIYPVYIVMIRSDTALAKVITGFTKTPYSHVSISFDSKMHNMYSFGRYMNEDIDYVSNEPAGRFTKEYLQNPELVGKGCPYCIYVTFVTKPELLLMKKRLQYFIDNRVNFRFNNAGLVKNYFGIESRSEKKYFCSQFVADILNTGNPGFTQKASSLMKPADFRYTEGCYFVCNGIIDEFDYRVVDKMTKQLKKQYIEEKLSDIA